MSNEWIYQVSNAGTQDLVANIFFSVIGFP
jgi:hypothetical protein